jgi:serine/threonine-protein kinase
MEYVAGGSLDKFWQGYGRSLMPTEIAVDLIKQVCRGIAVGHSENPPIIHRDIKPQNILIGYDCEGLRARVSDFGLAKRANPLTLLASARGTLCFKAPEVFRDPMHDSSAGDVWAIGCTLYLLLTDRLPFPDAVDGPLINTKAFERELEPPSAVNRGADRVLDDICLKALAINPKYRYKNAGELLADLEKWQPAMQGKDPLSHSDTSKELLGPFSPADEQAGRKLAAQALDLAKKPNRLLQAADVMEEAFIKYPLIRGQYEDLVKLWRRGISN